MKILLVNTPIWKITGFRSSYNPGMGLLYIGAVLREQGNNVRIIDAEAMGWWFEEIVRECKSGGFTHVGISSLSNGLPIAIELCEYLKKEIPNLWVVLGGVGPSAEPDKAKMSSADSICIGEGESIAERVFRERGVFYGEPIKDLDSLPSPAYDLLEPKIGSSYWTGNLPRPPENNVMETVVMWSRGCPHPCIFCLPRGTKILTAGLLWKNIEDVVVGEKLTGLTDGGFNKKYSETLVTKTFKRTSEILKITTEDGVVYSSPEHPWLTTHNRWIEASKLRVGWYMRKLSEPTEPPVENDSYKRGYLSGAIHGDGHIYEEDNDEYRKGFVAGMFDAEGSYSGSSLRISNLDVELLQRTLKYASHFGFKFKYEKKDARLIGKMSESVRFLATFNPKVIKKKGNLLKLHIKNHTRIVSVENLPGIVDVYNLETTGGNFVADGFVTHNCSKATMKRGKPRTRSPKKISEELKMLNKVYGINSVFVYDDELIGMGNEHEKWLTEISNELAVWNLDEHFNPVVWLKGQGRCSEKFVTEDTGRILKDAGFFAMMLGCESGSEKVKMRIKKGTTNQDIRHTLNIISKWVDIYGFWMVGMPEEIEDDIRETEKLIIELAPRMKWLQVTVFSPLPGSEFWGEALEKKWLSEDFNGTTNFQVAGMLNMPWLDSDTIQKWQTRLTMAYQWSRTGGKQ